MALNGNVECEKALCGNVNKIVLQEKKVKTNCEVCPDEGYGGLSRVVVDVEPDLEEKSANITTNGTHEFTPDKGNGMSKFTAVVNVDGGGVSLDDVIVESVRVSPTLGGGSLSVYLLLNGNRVNKIIGIPQGTDPITQDIISEGYNVLGVNGTHSCSGIIPSRTFYVTENGQYNIAEYASVDVNVEKGVFPIGTKTITENGTHDVTNYASVEVNVPTSSSDIELFALEFAKMGAGSEPLTAELTGLCVNTRYADWYAQSKGGNDYSGANKAIYNSGIKYIDTDLQELNWHNTEFTTFILQKNVPFIIWRTNTTPLSNTGLTNSGDMQTRTVDGTTYYGYVYTYSGTANNIILDGR